MKFTVTEEAIDMFWKIAVLGSLKVIENWKFTVNVGKFLEKKLRRSSF